MDAERNPTVPLNSTASTQFCWKLCILDDKPKQPPLPAYEKILRNLGVDFRTYGGHSSTPRKLGFLRDSEAKQFLRACNMFFVDMQWTNLSSQQQSISPPDLWVHSDTDQGLSDFADVMETGAVLPSTKRLASREIPNHLKGFWIAAALSHLNPTARIVFFSNAPEAIEGAEAGAFMQFKTRPVHILKKPDPSNELPEEFEDMFAQQIETLQNHALSTSEEVNRWFVTCIMLPTLLGLDPLEDTCGPFLPSDRPDTMWILSAQRFFPQWARWQRDERLLEKLKNFLRHDIFRLTAAQRRALNSVRHILKRAVRSGLNPATLAEAEKVVYQVGQPGWSLLQRIIEARQSRSLEQVQIAISLCELIGQSAQSQLWDLCQEFRTKYNSPESEYQCDDFVMRKPASDPGNAAKQEADPPLPFDIEFLRRACEALIDNAKKHFTDQEKHMRISLQVQDSHDHVAITYRDNSQGFPSLDALSKAVNDSMERNKAGAGLNRGLPLVLAFGLHFPLNSLQIKYNDGCWFQLYPERREIDAEAEKGFGVRWCFMYPGRSAMRSEIE